MECIRYSKEMSQDSAGYSLASADTSCCCAASLCMENCFFEYEKEFAEALRLIQGFSVADCKAGLGHSSCEISLERRDLKWERPLSAAIRPLPLKARW